MSRTYVITGAASGIGAATASLIESQGHRVIGVDLRDADVCVDLATPDGRAQLVDDIERMTGGSVDAVIAGAGTVGRGETDVRVNYFGAVATLAGLQPLLARGSTPRAVVIASFALLETVDVRLVEACIDSDEPAAARLVTEGAVVEPMRVYASTKRALARWVRAMAPTTDWAGTGVALNTVAPGIVRTPMTAPLLGHPATAEMLCSTVPMPFGGIADAESIAHVLAFLAAAELRSVTGQTLFVDGGADCVRNGDDVWS